MHYWAGMPDLKCESWSRLRCSAFSIRTLRERHRAAERRGQRERRTQADSSPDNGTSSHHSVHLLKHRSPHDGAGYDTARGGGQTAIRRERPPWRSPPTRALARITRDATAGLPYYAAGISPHSRNTLIIFGRGGQSQATLSHKPGRTSLRKVPSASTLMLRYTPSALR